MSPQIQAINLQLEEKVNGGVTGQIVGGGGGGGRELSCGEGVTSLGVVVIEQVLIENETQIQAVNLQLEEQVWGGVTGQVGGGGQELSYWEVVTSLWVRRGGACQVGRG